MYNVHVYMYIRVCTCTCTCTVCVYNVYAHVQSCIYVCVCTCTCTVYIPTCTLSYTCTLLYRDVHQLRVQVQSIESADEQFSRQIEEIQISVRLSSSASLYIVKATMMCYYISTTYMYSCTCSKIIYMYMYWMYHVHICLFPHYHVHPPVDLNWIQDYIYM